MKPHKLTLHVVIFLCGVIASTTQVRATAGIDASVDSSYFKARKDINMNVQGGYPAIILYMRSYLQAHRAIKQNSSLAQKLARQRPELDRTAHLSTQLKQLNLDLGQIQRQSDKVYTIHLLTYQRNSTLQQYVNQRWLKNELHLRKVYKSQRKAFIMFIPGGDLVAKSDPLFLEPIVSNGRKMTRVCYGIYEHQADANLDRRLLEKQLGQRLSVIHSQLTTEMIESAWLKSLFGTNIQRWESNH